MTDKFSIGRENHQSALKGYHSKSICSIPFGFILQTRFLLLQTLDDQLPMQWFDFSYFIPCFCPWKIIENFDCFRNAFLTMFLNIWGTIALVFYCESIERVCRQVPRLIFYTAQSISLPWNHLCSGLLFDRLITDAGLPTDIFFSGRLSLSNHKMFFIYYVAAAFYRASSRETKRLDSIMRFFRPLPRPASNHCLTLFAFSSGQQFMLNSEVGRLFCRLPLVYMLNVRFALFVSTESLSGLVIFSFEKRLRIVLKVM